MKSFVFVGIFCFGVTSAFSQLHSIRKDFSDENLCLEVRRLDYDAMQYGMLYRLDDGVLVGTFALSDEPDLILIQETYFENRKWIVLSARWDYYLINIDSVESYGPFRPRYRRGLEDAIDGLIKDFQFHDYGNVLSFMAAGDQYYYDISDSTGFYEFLTNEVDGAWVRDSPSNGNVIMKLPIGTKCKILAVEKEETINGQFDYWYKVQCDEKVGYIFGAQTSVKD